MDKSKLINITKQLLNHIRIAESERKIYEYYCNYNGLCGEGMDITPCFWSTTMYALVHSMMLELAKIYDKHEDVYGIPKLISICTSNSFLFGDKKRIIGDIESEYKGVQELAEQLRKQRNKYWIHNDVSAFSNRDSILSVHKLCWGDIESLIRAACRILNKILNGLGEPGELFCLDNCDDVVRIFDTMQRRAEDKASGRFREYVAEYIDRQIKDQCSNVSTEKGEQLIAEAKVVCDDDI